MSATGACMVMGGCQLNVITLEFIVQKEKNIGYLLTFFQFTFVALCALLWVFDFRHCRWRPFQLPFGRMLWLSFLFWVVSALNNAIFMFDISIPVHTTFRSSSLMVSMVLGWALFRKQYSAAQILCAVAITVGIFAMTMEAKRRSDEEKLLTATRPTTTTATISDVGLDGGTVESFTDSLWQHPMIGIALLSVSTILAAVLGVMQESMLSKFRGLTTTNNKKEEKKDGVVVIAPPPLWAEMMFTCHALSAPMFFFVPQRMVLEWSHVVSNAQFEELSALIALNCLTQFFCIIGVYRLVDASSAFTVTLTLTLRKFFSLLFSIVYFRHFERLSVLDFAGIGMVALGSMLYSFAPKAAAAPTPVDVTQKEIGKSQGEKKEQ